MFANHVLPNLVGICTVSAFNTSDLISDKGGNPVRSRSAFLECRIKEGVLVSTSLTEAGYLVNAVWLSAWLHLRLGCPALQRLFGPALRGKMTQKQETGAAPPLPRLASKDDLSEHKCTSLQTNGGLV